MFSYLTREFGYRESISIARSVYIAYGKHLNNQRRNDNG
nr:MAG TPA: hypothetical protein [Caudoviricetes sp.]